MRIVPDGLPFALIPALLAIVLFALGYWYVGAIVMLVSAFMAFFFRDPHREPPQENDIVVAPADGRIMRIEPLVPDRPGGPTLVSIFLSPFDVHVNRAPLAGRITDLVYARGKFLMATNNDASLVNEQNCLTIEGESATVVCKQIAGFLARRIVCWKHKGDRVALGERFGMIKFGSRTDLVRPGTVKVIVKEGMRVHAGTSIVGRIQR